MSRASEISYLRKWFGNQIRRQKFLTVKFQ